jgi:hypothetical protein
VKDQAEVNTEVARMETSGLQDEGHGNKERGVVAASDRDLLRCSVDILRDLGLSKEKIIAYHRRFPTPTLATGRGPLTWAGWAQERVS